MENLAGEIWKDVFGYEGFYLVSNMGRAACIKGAPYIMRPVKNRYGYLNVNLTKPNTKKIFRSIHRMVMLAFTPNPESLPMVNHLNGVKDDNRLVNLEWTNNQSNAIHAISIGLFDPSSPKYSQRKFTQLQANAIAALRKANFNYEEIGALLSIKASVISNLLRSKESMQRYNILGIVRR